MDMIPTEEQKKIIETAGIKCEEYRQAGFHCGEAIIRGCNDALGLNIPDDLLRATAGFSGGGGGARETCGLVASGTALISWLHDRVHLNEDFAGSYYLIRIYHEKFHHRFGSINCKVLRPDNKYLQGLWDCGPIFAPAAEILAEVLLNAETYIREMPECEMPPEEH